MVHCMTEKESSLMFAYIQSPNSSLENQIMPLKKPYHFSSINMLQEQPANCSGGTLKSLRSFPCSGLEEKQANDLSWKHAEDCSWEILTLNSDHNAQRSHPIWLLCPDQHSFFGSGVSYIMPNPMHGETVICEVGTAPRGCPNLGTENGRAQGPAPYGVTIAVDWG